MNGKARDFNYKNPDYVKLRGEIKSLITGRPLNERNTMADMVNYYSELFGDDVNQIASKLGLHTTQQLFQTMYQDPTERPFNIISEGRSVILRPVKDETNSHILNMKNRDKPLVKKSRQSLPNNVGRLGKSLASMQKAPPRERIFPDSGTINNSRIYDPSNEYVPASNFTKKAVPEVRSMTVAEKKMNDAKLLAQIKMLLKSDVRQTVDSMFEVLSRGDYQASYRTLQTFTLFENYIHLNQDPLGIEIKTNGAIHVVVYNWRRKVIQIYEKYRDICRVNNMEFTVRKFLDGMQEESMKCSVYGFQTFWQLLMKLGTLQMTIPNTNIHWSKYVLSKKSEPDEWAEIIERACKLCRTVELVGKTLTTNNFIEHYRVHFKQDVPIERLSPSNLSVESFITNLVNVEYSRLRKNPLYLAGHVIKIKPKVISVLSFALDITDYKCNLESRYVQTIFNDGDRFEVKLNGEVFSTNNFHVIRAQDISSLDKLTKEMNEYYTTATDKISGCPIIGSAVASFDYEDNSWLRAEVIDFYNDDVTIEYIDYGTIINTSFKELRWLSPQFVRFPRMGISVNLFRLKSRNAQSSHRLDKTVHEVINSWNVKQCVVHMEVHHINAGTSGRMSVRLSNYSGYFDDHIMTLSNKSDGFAIWSEIRPSPHFPTIPNVNTIERSYATSSLSGKSDDSTSDDGYEAILESNVAVVVKLPFILNNEKDSMIAIILRNSQGFIDAFVPGRLIDRVIEEDQRLSSIDRLKSFGWKSRLPMWTLSSSNSHRSGHKASEIGETYDISPELQSAIFTVIDKEYSREEYKACQSGIDRLFLLNDLKLWRANPSIPLENNSWAARAHILNVIGALEEVVK